MRRDRDYLLDMLTAAQKIEQFTSAMQQGDFKQDEVLQNAVVRLFTVLGEASRLLSDTLKTQHPQIPWAQIAGMRNRIVHVYWEIDTEILWNAIQLDIPQLIVQLQSILASSADGEAEAE